MSILGEDVKRKVHVDGSGSPGVMTVLKERTIAFLAQKGSVSLRITIPIMAAKTLRLEAGSVVVWTVDLRKGTVSVKRGAQSRKVPVSKE